MGDLAGPVDLCTDDTPRRPAKRLRPEPAGKQVLSLVDSDDDGEPSDVRPRDKVGQTSEKPASNPRLVTHWGALESAEPRDPAGERPVYRPSSARFRRLPLTAQLRPNPVTGAIVIDEEDDELDSYPMDRAAFRRVTPARQQAGAADGPAAVSDAPSLFAPRGQLFSLASGLNTADWREGPAATVGLRAAGSSNVLLHNLPSQLQRREQQHQQQQQQEQQQAASPPGDSPVLLFTAPAQRAAAAPHLPRRPIQPRILLRTGGPAIGAVAAAVAEGGGRSGEDEASSSPATASSSPLSVAEARAQRVRFGLPPQDLIMHQQHQEQQQQPQQRLWEPQQGSDRRRGLEFHRQLQTQQRRQQQLRRQQMQQDEEEALRQAAVEAEHEDEDMRFAARLQQEEDERLARETARQMEQEEHRRVMAAAAARAAADDAAAGVAGGRASAVEEALASIHGRLRARGVRPAGAAPDGLPGDLAEAGAVAAEATDLAARWSRLEMFENLESAAEERAARNALAVETETAFRRAAAAAARAGGRGGGSEDGGRADAEGHREPGGWRLHRYLRAAETVPSMLMAGGGGGPRGGGRGLRSGEAVAEGGPDGTAAAAAAAAAAAGGRGRWSSRGLQDVLPAMAMGLPYGLQRVFLGVGQENEGPAGRRGRAMAAAYREQAMAMREQLMAAQRAGLPAHVLLSDRDFTPEDYEMLCRLDERVENRKGAKDEQLTALPTQVVGAGGRRRSDGCAATCTICMEELAAGDVLKQLPCGHDFHGDCVDTWLRTKACCPICQRNLDG